MTGVHPNRLPLTRKGTFTLNAEARTVPEMLDEAGYDRVMYTLDYVLVQTRGIDQGFRTFERPYKGRTRRWEYANAAPPLTEKVLAFLDDAPPIEEKPYLFVAHYRCPHSPYLKHDEADFGDSDIDRYDSAIAHCDHHVGRVLARLAQRPDADQTAVLVLSDHGEEFGTNGHYEHGESVDEAGVRSLLLIHVPGSTEKTVDVPVTLTDAATTMLDLAGLKAPKGADGWSLVPLMFGQPAAPAFERRPIFLYADHTASGARHETYGVVLWPYKYVWSVRYRAGELYDVASDPEERNELQRPDDMSRRADLLEAWLASTRHKPEE